MYYGLNRLVYSNQKHIWSYNFLFTGRKEVDSLGYRSNKEAALNRRRYEWFVWILVVKLSTIGSTVVSGCVRLEDIVSCVCAG